MLGRMTWTAPQITRQGTTFAAGERQMLEAGLDFHRQTLLSTCSGLTAEQLRQRSAPPSTMSLLGLVRHMTDVERADAPPLAVRTPPAAGPGRIRIIADICTQPESRHRGYLHLRTRRITGPAIRDPGCPSVSRTSSHTSLATQAPR